MNGKSSLTQNILHEKSLQYRNMRLKQIGYRRRIASCVITLFYVLAQSILRVHLILMWKNFYMLRLLYVNKHPRKQTNISWTWRFASLTLKHKQTIPHSTTYWYCFINPRLKVTSRSRARPWGAEWTAWLTVLLMRFLCHYVGDMSAQSFLIVHHLVMCQNFLILRYPKLIADGAVPFFSCLSNTKICFSNIEA